MRVANHRVPAYLRVKFRLSGPPLEFANQANATKYLPAVRGEEFVSFAVKISRTFVEDTGRAPYNPNEPMILAEVEVKSFVQKFMTQDTQFSTLLKIEILSVEVLREDPSYLP